MRTAYNPQGIRIGQERSGERRAVKVWERREFSNLDDSVELGTRNLKLALRKLRKFAREGAADQLDLEGTIDATARNAGLLDLKLVPERHNAVKVLLFLDVGGSMDDHVRVCEELFSAARSEFKHLEHFYFHNFIYENLWKDNAASLRRADTDRAGAAHLRARLPRHPGGGCDHEPVRDHPARRQYRALEQGAGARVDAAAVRGVPTPGVAQSGGGGALGLQPLRAPDHARWCASACFPSRSQGLDLAIRELKRPLGGPAAAPPTPPATPITQHPPPRAS